MDPATGRDSRRKRALLWVLLVFALAAIGYGSWWLLVGRWVEGTDDAYVGGNVVQITPQISGTVVAVRAEETDFVRMGDELVRLDGADASIALEQAEAQLARTVRQLRSVHATDSQLGALVAQREAELARAQQDLARREPAAASGAVSAEELQHARDARDAARAALDAARAQLRVNRTLIDRTTIAQHPDVRAAAAKLREAFLAAARTALPAPVSGFVARRSVQIGQRVAAGAPLMAVVPLERLWVDANFKESQLAGVRLGQAARVTADFYGGRVEYHGRVAGFGAGTGAAFALLPAQNATGNWIKVVQRVPVRIALDPQELAAHPLKIGLSTRVEIDTRAREDETTTQPVRAPLIEETRVFEQASRAADERIEKVIAENGGGRSG